MKIFYFNFEKVIILHNSAFLLQSNRLTAYASGMLCCRYVKCTYRFKQISKQIKSKTKG